MTDKTATVDLGKQRRKSTGLYLACGILMILLLLFDLSVPLGVAMGAGI
jgi:hypothetical protein